MRSVRFIAILALTAVLLARVFGLPDFGGVLPIPSGLDADTPVWLVIVEEKSDRPNGMEIVERSQWWADLADRKVSKRVINDDDPGEVAQQYVSALGSEPPGFLLVSGEDGSLVTKGKLPDPTTTKFFDSILKDWASR